MKCNKYENNTCPFPRKCKKAFKEQLMWDSAFVAEFVAESSFAVKSVMKICFIMACGS